MKQKLKVAEIYLEEGEKGTFIIKPVFYHISDEKEIIKYLKETIKIVKFLKKRDKFFLYDK